jgi:thiol-disulfide isomerase/thioredoxin
MERSSKITLTVIICIVALVGTYTFYVTQKNDQLTISESGAGASLNTEQGESAYTDIDGNLVAVDEHLGEILVVNSWASWCPFCANELPDLARLGREYADKNVTVLAINRAEPNTTAMAFLKNIDATEGLQLILDSDDRFYSSIDGFTMPETVFYDTQGNVVFHKRGMLNYEEMKMNVEAVLNAEAD